MLCILSLEVSFWRHGIQHHDAQHKWHSALSNSVSARQHSALRDTNVVMLLSVLYCVTLNVAMLGPVMLYDVMTFCGVS